MNFYKRYLGDYQRDTGHLSMAEHGAYTLMLDVYYATERPLPRDRKALYRLLRAIDAEDQAAVDSILGQFWTEIEDGWINPRASEEITKAEAQAETNRRIAAKREADRKQHESDTNRATNRATNRSTNAQPNHSHSHSQKPEPKPEPERGGFASPKTSFRASAHEAPPGQAAESAGFPADSQTPVTRVWTAYAAGYRDRYGLDPPRNAKANALCKQLVERLGLDEAIAVAGWYPSHRGRWHVEKGHALGVLVSECETLRTQWATGKTITSAQAREEDGREKRGQVWQKLIEEADGDEPQTLSE